MMKAATSHGINGMVYEPSQVLSGSFRQWPLVPASNRVLTAPNQGMMRPLGVHKRIVRGLSCWFSVPLSNRDGGRGFS